MKPKKAEIFSIPNVLSYFRIILIPCFVYVYVTSDTQAGHILAAVIILVSGLTDLLDGKIARKFNMITELGKALDPLADKLTQAAISICLMLRIQYFGWIFAIVLVKESFMLVCNVISMKIYGRRLGGAEWFGKVTTTMVYIGTFLLILMPHMAPSLQIAITITIGGFLIMAWVLYIPVFGRLFRDEYEYTHPQFINRDRNRDKNEHK